MLSRVKTHGKRIKFVKIAREKKYATLRTFLNVFLLFFKIQKRDFWILTLLVGRKEDYPARKNIE